MAHWRLEGRRVTRQLNPESQPHLSVTGRTPGITDMTPVGRLQAIESLYCSPPRTYVRVDTAASTVLSCILLPRLDFHCRFSDSP